MVARRVGVLALQGDVAEHLGMLERLGCAARPVRRGRDLEGVDGLIIPGGESTTILRLLTTSGLRDVLGRRLDEGLAVLGTCAGLIVLASDVLDGRDDQWSYGVLDLSLRRNGYGRQIASFEATVEVAGIGPFHGVFIRAPRVVKVADDVEVLATLERPGETAHPVLVRRGRVWGSSFHPELSGDPRVHRLFVDSI